jgi:hypothetical protein
VRVKVSIGTGSYFWPCWLGRGGGGNVSRVARLDTIHILCFGQRSSEEMYIVQLLISDLRSIGRNYPQH